MSNITRRDPLDDFFRGFFVRPVDFGGNVDVPSIKIDVKEQGEAYKVHAELPGIKKEDIHVHIDGPVVSISAERKQDKEEKEGERVLRTERYFGQVSRSFQLGQDVDEGRASARFNDGVEDIKDLKEGMILEGTVSNVAAFGAFVAAELPTFAQPVFIRLLPALETTGTFKVQKNQLKLDGVVIVSTPQEIALIDARRAAAMFLKTATPILGVVENMAYFADASGARVPIFGEGGAKAEAVKLGVPLLGEIPLDVALRQACDDGKPVSAAAARPADVR